MATGRDQLNSTPQTTQYNKRQDKGWMHSLYDGLPPIFFTRSGFTVRGETAAGVLVLLVSLFIGSPFKDKAHAINTWGGGFMVEVAKWQSGKVSGFCHLDFATSFFKGMIP